MLSFVFVYDQFFCMLYNNYRMNLFLQKAGCTHIMAVSTAGTVYFINASSGDMSFHHSLSGAVFGSPLMVCLNTVIFSCTQTQYAYFSVL